MGAAALVGRVGALAVTLGVGVAVSTGYGVAAADTPGSETTGSTTSADSPAAADTAPETGATPPAPPTAAPDPTDGPTPSTGADEPEPAVPPGVTVSTGGAHVTATPTVESEPPSPPVVAKEDDDPTPAGHSTPTGTEEPAATTTRPASSVNAFHVAAQPADLVEPPPPATALRVDATLAAAAPTSAAAAPAALTAARATPAPSLTTNPIALVAGYVTGIAASLVDAVLHPLLVAGGLPLPDQPLTMWTLLAYVRRELFNTSPSISPVVGPSSNGLVVGNVGAIDPDGDALTYTLVGSPRAGGTVTINPANGNFVYRPTGAMAEVGGVDQFTVVVSDEASGFHIHGPAGLFEFAPIASPIVAALSLLPGVGSLVAPLVAILQRVPILGDLLQPYGKHAAATTITVTVTPTPGQDLSFPAGFHWGVAYGGFQNEMGGGAPNDVNSDEWAFLHDPVNGLLGDAPGLPENGPGSYLTYATDAQLAAHGVGADTFRLGIEWSRIFPTSTAAVDASDGISDADLAALDLLADHDAVAHYAAVFAAVRAAGLDPMVTINHYTLPTWVQDPSTLGGGRIPLQLGLPGAQQGWLSADTVDEFEKYAAYLAWKYGDQVDTWLVLNEPTVYPLGGLLDIPGGPVPPFPPGVFRPDLISTFLVNEANAYVAASGEIHARDPGAQVGFANSMTMFRPATPLNPLDVEAAAAFNDFYNRWFPDAVMLGRVDANLDGVITADEFHPEMAGSADFLGVNYYQTGTVSGLGLPVIPGFPLALGLPKRTFTAADCPTAACSTDTGQPIDPGGLREVLAVAATYGKPIWITENGISNGDDSQRPSYVLSHLAVVQDVIATDHTDIRGYTYWSLVDVLEWSDGYRSHFGLYSFDPDTLVRTPRPSVAVLHQIAADNALSAALLAAHPAITA